ncbi:unnamed protein product [Acanthoscelides obtectus]|uniref:Secreted protein n=1 Tax=Acanthoscelides obtectus TaxID=200917 RepID=A0A9P0QA67_ACAOB|nr:unnamed protein product [Acanthoscelides obtectus]CAK1645963.1 hypothetical protein AOBTE_LOCUS14360 [Acanthoscelides obtectus]
MVTSVVLLFLLFANFVPSRPSIREEKSPALLGRHIPTEPSINIETRHWWTQKMQRRTVLDSMGVEDSTMNRNNLEIASAVE